MKRRRAEVLFFPYIFLDLFLVILHWLKEPKGKKEKKSLSIGGSTLWRVVRCRHFRPEAERLLVLIASVGRRARHWIFFFFFFWFYFFLSLFFLFVCWPTTVFFCNVKWTRLIQDSVGKTVLEREKQNQMKIKHQIKKTNRKIQEKSKNKKTEEENSFRSLIQMDEILILPRLANHENSK